MTRILLIMSGYGLFLLVFTYGIVWCVGRLQQHEQRKPQPKRIVFRDDGSLAEVNSAPGQRARQYNHPSAPGLDRDRRRVN